MIRHENGEHGEAATSAHVRSERGRRLRQAIPILVRKQNPQFRPLPMDYS